MARSFRVGGSFAPQIDSAKASAYFAAISAHAPRDLKDTLLALVDMVNLFNQTPPSTNPPRPHPMGKVTIVGKVGPDGKKLKPDVMINPRIVDLEEAEIKRIWDAVPWGYEIDALQHQLNIRFDSGELPNELRTPAYHLLWYARELTLDREPLTMERVKE